MNDVWLCSMTKTHMLRWSSSDRVSLRFKCVEVFLACVLAQPPPPPCNFVPVSPFSPDQEQEVSVAARGEEHCVGGGRAYPLPALWNHVRVYSCSVSHHSPPGVLYPYYLIGHHYIVLPLRYDSLLVGINIFASWLSFSLKILNHDVTFVGVPNQDVFFYIWGEKLLSRASLQHFAALCST